MYRSLSFSFGPICFGSLLQGVCKALRSVLHHANKPHGDHYVHDPGDDCRCCCFGLFGVLLDGLSGIFGDVLDYFSQWSYVLVGIYGRSYLDSGKRVMELFQNVGWTVVVTDRLVGFVLGFVIVENGIVTGLVALGVERWVTSTYGDGDEEPGESWVFGPLPGWPYYAFAIGFLMGIVVSSVMMSVIQGAVNTLIVCWADLPSSFRENHPDWAEKLIEAWSSAFPQSQLRHQSPTTLPAADACTTAVYGTTVL
jgi:hypothetical protein